AARLTGGLTRARTAVVAVAKRAIGSRDRTRHGDVLRVLDERRQCQPGRPVGNRDDGQQRQRRGDAARNRGAARGERPDPALPGAIGETGFVEGAVTPLGRVAVGIANRDVDIPKHTIHASSHHPIASSTLKPAAYTSTTPEIPSPTRTVRRSRHSKPCNSTRM